MYGLYLIYDCFCVQVVIVSRKTIPCLLECFTLYKHFMIIYHPVVFVCMWLFEKKSLNGNNE